jgi:DSF synthase
MEAIKSSPTTTSEYFNELITRLEPDYGIMWYYMNPKPRPCMTVGMVEEMRKLQRSIQNRAGFVHGPEGEVAVRYMVYASASPEVFNLGGDLDLVIQAIHAKDRNKLLDYANLCVDVLYANLTCLDLPLTTISLIRGDALGGGFESALSSNVLVAERGSQLGFPEVLFNLFPGVGAYSLLMRRIGAAQAERMILSGRIYTAEELHDMGLIDVLAEPGQGEHAVREYVRQIDGRQNAFHAIHRVRHVCNPVSHEELREVAAIWAEAALQLGDRDLRVIERLLRAQTRKATRSGAERREARSSQR